MTSQQDYTFQYLCDYRPYASMWISTRFYIISKITLWFSTNSKNNVVVFHKGYFTLVVLQTIVRASLTEDDRTGGKYIPPPVLRYLMLIYINFLLLLNLFLLLKERENSAKEKERIFQVPSLTRR